MISIIRLLQRKVFFSLLLLVSIYSIASSYIIKWIITPNQLKVERKLAQQEMERFTEALTRELKILDTMAHDWGTWNDTYTFVQDRNPEYIASNLNTDTLIGCDINLLYIYDTKGSLIWSRLIDLETYENIVLKEMPPSGIPSDHPLLHHPVLSSSITGLKKTASGPLLLASHPIITGIDKGPIMGTLVFGRLLTGKLLASLRQQTRVCCSLIRFDSNNLSDQLKLDIASLGPENPYTFRHKTNEILVYSLLNDYLGQSRWLLEVHANRSITAQAREILHYVFYSNCIIGFFTLLLFLYFYKNQIRTATASFRNLIEQSSPTDSRRNQKKDHWGIFTTNEFSKLSHDLRLMIAGYETTRTRDKHVITQHTKSLRDLNELLVEEVKNRFQIEENLHQIQMNLEEQVEMRTHELRQTNRALYEEIEERKNHEKELRSHRQRLRNLSSELMEMEDKERRQLATDLHDQIGQSLSAVKMYMDALIEFTPDFTTKANLQQIATIVDQTIHDARSLTFELSPPILYELGLDAALEWLAEELQKKYPLAITITCDDVPRDTTSAFLALAFRAIRELLMNVIHHAEADSAEVCIRNIGRSLHLKVIDDGCGMKDGDTPNTGFGLFSIRERVINIGGTVDIDSHQNIGTTITLQIPIQENSRKNRSNPI